jgi:uncharacterized protein YjbI with pentapeptide repeats
LERSVNDSATRVSTIWISFLIFGLYLLTAVGTVTHRQILLADPIKLPVLNIELPLFGFVVLAPILFVILHVYVLIQVLLLGRTAAAYNQVLDRVVKSPMGNASMRQRLANTLFAQLFAGSPSEREGWLGWLLKIMAWFTLAFAPVLVILFFQFTFLSYHSHLITWILRAVIALDLIAVLMIWRAALQPDHAISFRLVLRSWIPLLSAFVLVLFSWVALSFPGEPHAEWTRYGPRAPECQTKSAIFGSYLSFDRLYLRGVDVVDEDKLVKIEKIDEDRELPSAVQGKTTRSFRDRDLNCADLSEADLRRVDLTGAHLRGANLNFANLRSAKLNSADLEGAFLFQADLGETFVEDANLRDATLFYVHLERALINWAQLQGADMRKAQLQGAVLDRVHLQGADLTGAQLQGAVLTGVQLQGALLNNAQLQFADLSEVQLQGASLSGADLSAASLDAVGLQGTDLNRTVMQGTKMSATSVWRASNAGCMDARISGQLFDAILPTLAKTPELPLVQGTFPVTSENIENFITESASGIFNPRPKQAAIDRIRSGLIGDPAKDDTMAIEQVWHKCEQVSSEVSQADFEKSISTFLPVLFCASKIALPAKNWTIKSKSACAS